VPTRRGVAVAAIAVTCLVLGYLLGYRELDVLGCAAVAAGVLALLTVAWRPSVELSRDVQPTRVTRGEPAICALTVRNGSRWPAPRVVVRDRLGETTVPVEIPALRSGALTAVTYRLDTTRRGVFDVGPLRFSRHDPFGLAAAGRTVGDRRQLFVHPVTHPMSVAPSGRSRHLEGPLADTALGNSATFDRLREYTSGDDLRYIHWRSSARTGTLMVRENIDSSLPTTMVLLDTDRESYAAAAAFEEAVEVAASAMVDALRAGFPARCILPGGVVVGRGGRTDTTNCLDQLARAALGPTGGLADLLETLPRVRADSVLLAVSGRARAADVTLVHRIAPRFRRVALVVLSPSGDEALPDPGGALTVIAAPRAADACARWNALGRP
jgi:uncharacterized protein (DUF58 family)